MNNKIEQKRRHISQCHYSDEDNLAYADMDVNGERITIAAYEVGFFDELLECAKNDDEDINIDFESGDHFPYSIMYGGLFVAKWLDKECKDTENLIERLSEDFKNNKGCPLAVIDDDFRNMVASVFQGIYLDTNKSHWKMDLFIPFAALVQTNEAVNDRPCPTTYFPLPKGLLWESMMNRPWLFAARALQPLKPEQADSWQQYIDTARLYEAYESADIVFVDDEE
nr:hypothetical protein [uncultured Butyrivibrio sp.]